MTPLHRIAGRPTRHGETTQHLGLPACRALIAFGQGNYAFAKSLLTSLAALEERLGASHAQRNVLRLTLFHAIERIRRSASPLRIARRPVAAHA